MRASFESVSAEAFATAIEAGPATGLFREQFARYEPMVYPGAEGPDYQVYRGDLTVAGDFTAPGFCTLVVGNLTVEGYVDLRNPYERGFDEGGLFVVLGDVRCRVFAGEYGKCSFVDGSLVASDLIVNAYQDSSLVVTGDLSTRYFFGIDIWASVGGQVTMEYGDGYARLLPAEDFEDAVHPRHDVETSRRLLALDGGPDIGPHELMELVRAGRSPFR